MIPLVLHSRDGDAKKLIFVSPQFCDMKTRPLIAILSLTLLHFSCSKDKFETVPKIKIKSYNTDALSRNQQLIIKLEFTDKEGDLGNGKFVYIPKRLNQRPLPPIIPDYDSVKNVIPEFPDKNLGEFVLTLDYNFLRKGPSEPDTIFMRFVAVDRAGNKSDTVDSKQLIILAN
jgi:hypothetical protein